jgi:hypothetical protein
MLTMGVAMPLEETTRAMEFIGAAAVHASPLARHGCLSAAANCLVGTARGTPEARVVVDVVMRRIIPQVTVCMPRAKLPPHSRSKSLRAPCCLSRSLTGNVRGFRPCGFVRRRRHAGGKRFPNP